MDTAARNSLAAETTEDVQLTIVVDRNQLQSPEDSSPAGEQEMNQPDSIEPEIPLDPV